ncbi:MAG: electron transport complex subunit RsxE [Pantoea sp. Brub]|nr:electron transport complex subunit RsxE [Pantoea sp. Brub]
MKKDYNLFCMFGICPLIITTDTVLKAFSLSIIITITLVLSNIIISSTRNLITEDTKITVYLMTIACIVSCEQMLLNAYMHNVYLYLKIYIPLIITNCFIIHHIVQIASKNNVIKSVLYGLYAMLKITFMMLFLAFIREIFSKGTILSDIEQIFGYWSHIFIIHIIKFSSPMLLFSLTPGSFIILAFILAVKNAFTYKVKNNNLLK